MASKRHALEVDRTLKRIHDGISIFDELWEKIEAIPLSVRLPPPAESFSTCRVFLYMPSLSMGARVAQASSGCAQLCKSSLT